LTHIRIAALIVGLAPCTRVLPAQDSIPRHSTFTIFSHRLAERRTINVYTPPAYDSTRESFPVLYMPDGGLAEDFPHVVNTIDSLIRLKRIRQVIVIGIENTERRRDLTGPTAVKSDSEIAPRVGGSAAFRSFIREELMPEVRKRYRGTDETTIVGESLAGLFVLETMLLEPKMFRRYIALSPSLWWNREALVRAAARRLGAFDQSPRALYLAEANEAGIREGTAELAAILKAHAPPALTWYYVPRPDLEHSTIFRGVAPDAFVRVLN